MRRLGAKHALAAVVLAGVAAATPIRSVPAEEPSAFEWLVNEPVTLFDLGMLRLQQAMDTVARWLVDEGHASDDPWSGAYYEWRQRRIVAYVTVRERLSDPTQQRCRETFEKIRNRLLDGVPAGTRSAEIYLENLFIHPGFGNYGRPRKIGQDLVDLVRFEVTMLPPPPAYAGGQRVHCAGRLDTAPDDLAMTID